MILKMITKITAMIMIIKICLDTVVSNQFICIKNFKNYII